MNNKKHANLVKNLTTVAIAIIIYALIAYGMNFGLIPRATQSLLIKSCINIILSVSLCLVVGFLGELSLGHAGFYALGAYAGCIFAIRSTLPIEFRFLLSVLIGGTVAAVGGFLVSSSILRLRGDYLAIVTLAFGEIIRSFIKILPFTGGTSGLSDIPSLGNKFTTFTFGYALVLITILFLRNLVTSRHGRAITSIRDNAIAAESIGINIKAYKIKVFTIAAFFAGVAGVLLGHYVNYIEPANFNYNVSIEILVMVVLGGMGNIAGAMIAAVIITFLPELLRDFDQFRLLIYAIALIVMMLASANPKFIAFKVRVRNFLLSLKQKVLIKRGE